MKGSLPVGLSTADVLFTAGSMTKANNDFMMLYIDFAVQHHDCELVTAGSLDTHLQLVSKMILSVSSAF